MARQGGVDAGGRARYNKGQQGSRGLGSGTSGRAATGTPSGPGTGQVSVMQHSTGVVCARCAKPVEKRCQLSTRF
jgi:hypothetical protein